MNASKGKLAIEWVTERCQLTRDNDSQAAYDPTDWHADPRDIVDLVKRIVRVSLDTMEIDRRRPATVERRSSTGQDRGGTRDRS